MANENLFLNLLLEKDMQTKGMVLTVQFDSNAPNVTVSGDTVQWSPTNEELDFISEAFGLLSKGNIQPRTLPKSVKAIPPPPREEPIDEKSHEEQWDDTEKEVNVEDDQSPTVESESEQSSPAEPTEESKEEGKLFVQADSQTIDELIKKKQAEMEEGVIVEAGDEGVIDRVLKKKKK